MANAQFDERQVQVRSGNVALAFGTAEFALLQPTDRLSARIDQIWLSNNDTIDHVVSILYDDGAGDEAAVGGVNVPAGAGWTLPGVEAIALLCPTNTPFLIVPDFNPLMAKLVVAMVGASKLGYSVVYGYI